MSLFILPPLEWLFVFSIYFMVENSCFLSSGSLGKENSTSVRIPAHWTEAPSISRTLFPTLHTHQLRAFIAHLHELCAARSSHQAAMSFLHRAHQQMHRHHNIFIIANYCAAGHNLFSPVTLRAITVCCLCVCVCGGQTQLKRSTQFTTRATFISNCFN
jgi:hypothetical protein